MTSRDKIQQEALAKLLSVSGGKTLVLSPGTGKSKVAIDYLKRIKAKNILITSPRTNLITSWEQELEKWQIYKWDTCEYDIQCGDRINIEIVNIQTCYKWSKERIKDFDLIIADEIHSFLTPEYGKLMINAKELDITVLGLTGTPDNKKRDKALFYEQYCPIVYEYLDSAKDGIINKRKYIVYEYELTDKFQIEVKTKTKSWYTGEKKQYDYIQSQVKLGENLIKDCLEIPRGADEFVNYFGYAQSWYWGSDTTNKDKKKAGGTYMRAISNRQDLLWKLNSTSTLSKIMADYILREYSNSKLLVFSSRTEQAEKISKYCVHSKNSEEINTLNLENFNKGNIRQLGSCYSLTLGLNLTNTAFAIMESYNGSDVHFKQKSGRVDRLPVDEDAIVIFIVVKNTQGEKWFNNSVSFDEDDDVQVVKSMTEFKDALKELK